MGAGAGRGRRAHAGRLQRAGRRGGDASSKEKEKKCRMLLLLISDCGGPALNKREFLNRAAAVRLFVFLFVMRAWIWSQSCARVRRRGGRAR